MREIIFRGKNKNGGWVKGFYTKSPSGVVRISPTTMQAPKDVDPNTVGQYTGLADMHGVKIWEGDIVQYYGGGWDEEDGPGVIEWDQGTARFTIVNNGLTVDFDNCDGNEVKVIGNIYDNPELLEVEE